MSSGHTRFPASIQTRALMRQRYHCASCGLRISAIGEAGMDKHEHGERAEGHHLIPHKMAGPITVDNCVVMCRACHSNAHQAGRWGDISIYDDLAKLPMTEM